MQYLKDEVRNNIEREALKEFMEKGYEGASIRSIVKNANTSVGNMYKYFDSKQDLLEKVIGAVYQRVMDYITQIDNIEFNEKAGLIVQGLAEKIIDLFDESSAQINILLNKSKGSKYENCKSIFVDFITRIVTENMKYELSLKGKKLSDDFIIYVVSYSLVESISVIVREKHDSADVRKLVLNMIDIYYADLINKLDCKDKD